MKILVLTKRLYMGKDLLDDRFGRFWELPLELARLGHEVQGIALSYRKRAEGSFACSINSSGGSISWHSVNLFNAPWPALKRYLHFAQECVGAFQPDAIWACSDAYHAILGRTLANYGTARLVIDLYDNFESYAATRVPGILPFFKRAIRAADGVSCVSPQLAKYIGVHYRCPAPVLILENAIRSDLFRPMEKTSCRKQLGLPPDQKIIGTAGALFKSHGIETLYRGFEILAGEDSRITLAIAGPRSLKRNGIPMGPRVHDLGILPLETVPVFFNALDVATVCNRDSSFGRYNYPQKAREIMACGVPLVAANAGSMRDILRSHPECVFEPDDPWSLARAVHFQLAKPIKIESSVPDWSEMAGQLATFFQQLLNHDL
jgi:teichuronic acid biosynthesis glycosyltransferase TuaC